MTTTARGRTQPDAGTALATRRENGEVATNTLADQIRSMEKQFALAMPKGAEAAQLVRDALTALRTTRDLANCDGPSVLGSLMTCAQLGLRPGVLGHAWLLPFYDRRAGGKKAQLVIGYQGLIELAMRSGQIKSLIARTVYANDTFDVDYGLADSLVHKPNLFGDRGEPIAYYAIAKFASGGHAFVVMTHHEMLAYRNANATAKSRDGKVFGPWVDHFEAMALKTTIRQLAKYMPKSTDLAVAIAADEGIRVDLTPTVDAAEVTYHDTIDGEANEAEQEDAEARPITPAQKRSFPAAFTAAGITDPDEQRAYIAEVVGRDVASVDELTAAEAAAVLEKATAYAQQNEPPTGGAS